MIDIYWRLKLSIYIPLIADNSMGAVLEGQPNNERLPAVNGLREYLPGLLFNEGTLWNPRETHRRVGHHQDDVTTSLISAVQNRDSQYVEFLIKTGADVNVCDKNGNTPLLLAIQENDSRSICLLLEAGADVNKYNEDGNSALMMAAWRNDNPLVELLIRVGVDVNYINKQWHSFNCALGTTIQSYSHDRPMSQRLETVRLLLKGGAYVNIGSVPQMTKQGIIHRDFLRAMAAYRILLAAGDVTNLHLHNVYDPKWKKHKDNKSLKYMCREKLRSHLIHQSPVNLLIKVPKLGLPDQLGEYMVYDEFLFRGGKFV